MFEVITLVCPSCGGRTKFSADENILVCDYCGNQHTFRLPDPTTGQTPPAVLGEANEPAPVLTEQETQPAAASPEECHPPEAGRSHRAFLALVFVEVPAPGFFLYRLGWVSVLLVQHSIFHRCPLDHDCISNCSPGCWCWVDLLHPGGVPQPQLT